MSDHREKYNIHLVLRSNKDDGDLTKALRSILRPVTSLSWVDMRIYQRNLVSVVVRPVEDVDKSLSVDGAAEILWDTYAATRIAPHSKWYALADDMRESWRAAVTALFETMRVAEAAQPRKRPFSRNDRNSEIKLMGAAEIQKRLFVSRQRVNQLVSKPHFPKPVAVVEMGRLWLEEDVEAWIAKHRPKIAEDPEEDDEHL